ncbi:sarcosine oxidase subunit alpha [Sinirhodobacter populi]|uniref:Sarcosine oxidase subunit alpha n=1 Tax=Paenirhodobacter populi TaxID=2306993 RepID=A0A443K149_9RHOB|nr:2Fe-2S iron-sulfur cluster-binding protein [Sinirhodobacter populi]RWR26484.1 sarcosine oxidase subunit alpha [Sinirhodobacter populi]
MDGTALAGDGAITFSFNGRQLTGQVGDTLAVALWRNGIRRISTTRKRHLPLGLLGSSVSGSLARVDGIPNVRLDQAPLHAGAKIRSQNCWPAPGFDMTRALSLVPAPWLYGGFEHGALMPRGPRAFRLAEKVMSHLAGMADPPAPRPGQVVPGKRIEVDLLVVGGGVEGRRAANAAVTAGLRVALVTRSVAARTGRDPARAAEPLAPGVQLFPETEVFGIYRGGEIVAAAPLDATRGGLVFVPGRVVLATGLRSMPPLVAGNHLPGVIDDRAALSLALDHGVAPGSRISVFAEDAAEAADLARRLAPSGATCIFAGPRDALRRILGRSRVTGVETGTRLRCDCVIFAGSARPDPGLPFQASGTGCLQLRPGTIPARVALAGSCARPLAPLPLPGVLDDDAYVCACMDVTVGELRHHITRGITDLEVLKRLTSCGMGPCQGFPCWENMAAVVAQLAPQAVQRVPRPSHRAPRRALTVAQAAGMEGLVAPDVSPASGPEGGYE